MLVFFHHPASTVIYTLSLHTLFRSIAEFCSTSYGVTFPMFEKIEVNGPGRNAIYDVLTAASDANGDRKSTRLNSSHLGISYAVFCLKKKSITRERPIHPSKAKATNH